MSDDLDSVFIEVPSDGNNLTSYFDATLERLDSLQNSIDVSNGSISDIYALVSSLDSEDLVTGEVLATDESSDFVSSELCSIGSTLVGLQVVTIALLAALLGVLLGKILVDHWTVYPK